MGGDKKKKPGTEKVLVGTRLIDIERMGSLREGGRVKEREIKGEREREQEKEQNQRERERFPLQGNGSFVCWVAVLKPKVQEGSPCGGSNTSLMMSHRAQMD